MSKEEYREKDKNKYYEERFADSSIKNNYVPIEVRNVPQFCINKRKMKRC